MLLYPKTSREQLTQAWFCPIKKPVHGFFFVSYTGFEPVTSALSRQRSEPTELIALKRVVNVHNET
jgi:hypothetical protein